MRSDDFADESALTFYRKAVEEGAVHLDAMITLVEKLRRKAWSRGMPYSTSHDSLCLGDALPRVSVTYIPGARGRADGYYSVHYSTRAQEKLVDERLGTVDQAERLVDALILRAASAQRSATEG